VGILSRVGQETNGEGLRSFFLREEGLRSLTEPRASGSTAASGRGWRRGDEDLSRTRHGPGCAWAGTRWSLASTSEHWGEIEREEEENREGRERQKGGRFGGGPGGGGVGGAASAKGRWHIERKGGGGVQRKRKRIPFQGRDKVYYFLSAVFSDKLAG
jgi:hypothetical protein